MRFTALLLALALSVVALPGCAEAEPFAEPDVVAQVDLPSFATPVDVFATPAPGERPANLDGSTLDGSTLDESTDRAFELVSSPTDVPAPDASPESSGARASPNGSTAPADLDPQTDHLRPVERGRLAWDAALDRGQ